MSAGEAEAKENIFLQCHRALATIHHSEPPFALFVPGRIEFLGKHTDYAGGRSLLCAAERGFCLAAAPRDDNVLSVRDVVREVEISFPIGDNLLPIHGDWASYPMTVARRLAANFPGMIRGADIAFGSDLPLAAGLSSSSALVIAVFMILSHRNRLAETRPYQDAIRSREDLAEYLGCIENGNTFRDLKGDGGVGTTGGSQDHTAILFSKPDNLVEYRFGPIRQESILPFPSEYLMIIASSGVLAEKTGAARVKYNKAAANAREILRIWQTASGHQHQSLVDAGSPGDAQDRIRNLIRESRHEPEAGELLRRFEQLMMESTVLIPDAVQALRIADMRRLGEIVDLSQLLAERMLENQVPETIALARLARQHGAVAASAFGAGFGGSVWAMIEAQKAELFRQQWEKSYLVEFPERSNSDFFLTNPGPACMMLPVRTA
ncbi:MAG: galactokinase family protein [Gemmatimonadota bacterium]